MNTPTDDPPRVSVIIPTYNRADLVIHTLRSVLEQTFTSLEVLVVDDGSTDGTEQVVLGMQDKRVIYIRQKHSGLPAVARNTGLRRARGEYIAFLDSDDLWLREKLALQVTYMDNHPEVALSYTNTYRFIDDPVRCDANPMLRPEQAMNGYAFERLYGQQVVPNLTVMIRSSIIAEVGFFNEDERLKANEDYEYWLRIARNHVIGFINRPLAMYREHPGGISKAATATAQAKLFLVQELDELYPEFVAQHPQERRCWLARIHYHMGRALLREDGVRQGRLHLQQSWKLCPQPSTLLFWIASFLGTHLYRRLDGLKTRCARRRCRGRWDGAEQHVSKMA